MCSIIILLCVDSYRPINEYNQHLFSTTARCGIWNRKTCQTMSKFNVGNAKKQRVIDIRHVGMEVKKLKQVWNLNSLQAEKE